MIDLPPDIQKPAIIRPAPKEMLRPDHAERLRYGGDPALAMLPGIMPVVGSNLPTLTWLTSLQHSASTSTTVSFGNIVVPSPGLVIVLTALRGDSSGNVSGISIGGNAAGLVSGLGSGTIKRGIGYLECVAGTHNVTVTLSAQGGNVRNALGAWLLTGYISATPADTNVSNTSSGTSKTATLDIPARGIAVYAEHHANTNATTWSAATKRSQEAIQSSRIVSFADKNSIGAMIADVVTASWSGSAESLAFGASWR